MEENNIKKIVREKYGSIAREGQSCCGSKSSCCGTPKVLEDTGKKIGYSEEEMNAVPDGANLGLGCGNPVALASLKEGEIVLDLGAGAGFDCFLAAQKVGETGRIIGVDMTADMVEKARQNAARGGYSNVEFRLGEIEHLPVADNYADVIISNCVINLCPDKKDVFKDAFRVLKPGGRVMVSDIVLLKELPDFVRDSIEAYVGCVAGAIMKDSYIEAVKAAGFEKVAIEDESRFPVKDLVHDPLFKGFTESMGITGEAVGDIVDSVVSIKLSAYKPL